MKKILASFLGFTVLLALGCTEVPVYNLSSSFSIEIRAVSKNQDPIKLDFLWVVDNSSSMCQEQESLAASFDAFVSQLKSYLNVDINLAVVTSDVVKMQGGFVNTPAPQFPPACGEGLVHFCTTNDECGDAFGENWRCQAPGAADYPWLTNMNGSINTLCKYACEDDAACCSSFCYQDVCGDKQSCYDDKCADLPTDECNYECSTVGGNKDNATCVAQPRTGDCPEPKNLSKILTNKEIKYFHCIATVGADQTSQTANLEGGLKSAWMALDPAGPNKKQSADFLREDAYLVVVFISDEDDCSIDDEFCSPSYTCTTDADCITNTHCVDGLCCGIIKKDYYSVCSLLGEYKGGVHHGCAYDLACSDCEVDADCDDGWACKKVRYGNDKYSYKCRPDIYDFSTFASMQFPAGTPLFSLAPVSAYYSRLRSLKKDPAKVLVASIVGDAIMKDTDADSLISQKCLDNVKIKSCVNYQEVKEAAGDVCTTDPSGKDCLALIEARKDCARECYVAAKGEARNPEARNAYVCSSPFGKADFGSRYVRLARMFGPNGVVSSICSEKGIGPALVEVAELIIKRVTKICLPRPVKEGEKITVIRNSTDKDGKRESVILVEGDPPEGQYTILSPTQDCCFVGNDGLCTGTLTAVTFNEVLDPSWEIELKYQADVPLE